MSQYSEGMPKPRIATALFTALLAACASAPVAPPAPEPEPVVAEPAPPAPPEPIPAFEAAPAAPASPPPVLKADAPLRYVVQPGDTLWGIAQRFLAEPWQWPEVWFVNEQVANPHLIYPGDVLTLRMRDGRPVVARETDDFGDRVLRLSPQVRVSELDQAIPAIPLEAIRDFLNSPRMIGATELARAPYVVAFGEDQLVAGANSPAYVQNLPPEADYRWAIVRPDTPIVDPETRQTLGFAATPVGGLEIRAFTQPATAWITRSDIEARIGDRLVAIEEAGFEARFQPRAPQQPVAGTVVWLADQRLQVTQYQVVAINRGRVHGLEPGHVLTILQRGRIVQDPVTRRATALPPLDIGRLIVFKVDERLAFGLVLDNTRPVRALDGVESPARL